MINQNGTYVVGDINLVICIFSPVKEGEFLSSGMC